MAKRGGVARAALLVESADGQRVVYYFDMETGATLTETPEYITAAYWPAYITATGRVHVTLAGMTRSQAWAGPMPGDELEARKAIEGAGA